MSKLKEALQDHYQIYLPQGFVSELEKLGATDIKSTVKVIKANYLKRVSRYILNDYQLIDNYGGVKFKGSLLIVNPEQSLYSNGIERKFDDYMGLGAIDSLFKAIKTELNKEIEIYHYGSSAITGIDSGFENAATSEAKVLTLIGIRDNNSNIIYWGVGESSNALRSAVDSLLSAINRMDA